MQGEEPTSTVTAAAALGANRLPRPATGTGPSFDSPDQVLYENELMRGRLWVAVTTILGLGGVLSAAVLEVPGREARVLLCASSGAVLLASLVAVVLLRADDRYGAPLAALYSYGCLLAVVPAFHFFGWFSPIAVLVALGAVIFAMGHTGPAVVTLCIAVVASHAALGILTIAEVVPDRGISMVRLEGTHEKLVCLGLCELMFLMAFVIGRQLRGHALVGIERYGEVVRENTRRETLLQEAAEELRRARNVGANGRYTDLRVGPFRLGVVLGRGAMGEVYDARHEPSGTPAAVKVITPTGEVTDRAVRRFEREIDLAGSVESPHIVRVLGHSMPGDSVLYLAMERLRGESLSDELRSLRRPSIPYVLEMLRQVGRGISDAHDAGVVHRDLSPKNVFHHTGDGEDVWKVLDFGVSTFVGSQSSLTAGGVVGTPSYMSPEQATGQDVDQRADLFALGCIAYRCLTGQRAFRGNAFAEVLYRVVHESPAQPSSLAKLPLEVDLVLAVALAKRREDRFASADELVNAVADACRGAIDASIARRARALLASAHREDAP